MNWKFWKKSVTEEAAPTVLVIPAEKVRGLLRLRDAYNALPKGQDSEAKFLLWNAIAEIFPEVREGLWNMESITSLRIEIVSRPKEA